jgi:predicted dehydrogenase
MYLGKPDSVFAHTIQIQPERFPKVDDSAAILLQYKNGVALLEGSWDLPHGFQQVEVFGRQGSVFAKRGEATVRMGRRGEPTDLPRPDLGADKGEPIAYMLHCIRNDVQPEGMTSLEHNLGVNEIIEAAKISIKTGKAVSLPLSN